MLELIVETDKINVAQKLSRALAISLRADGSVDRTQIDNVHVMAHVVTETGLEETLFLGFCEPKERGAIGYFKAIQDATSFTLKWDNLFPLVSSVVTDGASINTGERRGLWAQLQEMRDKSTCNAPLLKIWCSVHRSALAWKSVCSSVVEVQSLLLDMTGLASYFRQSGIRTRKLRDVAVSNGFKVSAMPKFFEVRWTEFTHSLCYAIVSSWRAIATYLSTSVDKDAPGYMKKWTDYNRVKLLCFLTDVTFIYSRFQKSIQRDDIHLDNIATSRQDVVERISRMENTPLLGGWEEAFCKNIVELDDTTQVNDGGQADLNSSRSASLYGIKLVQTRQRRGQHNLYVSDRRLNDAIKKEVVCSLINFLNDRLDATEFEGLTPLQRLCLDVSDEDLRECHRVICPDQELLLFADSYRSVAALGLQHHSVAETVAKVLQLGDPDLKLLTISLARMLAAKPHSADVERLISYYNLLKTSDRSSMTPSVVHNSMYIRINMPPLDQFDPMPAVIKWLSVRDRQTHQNEKAKKQEWFRGVFLEADRQSSTGEGSTTESVVHF